MAWLAWQAVSLASVQTRTWLSINISGLPHPSLFPLEQVKFDCLTPSASLSNDRDVGNATTTETLGITVGRGSAPGDLDLTQFLQYGAQESYDHGSETCTLMTEARFWIR